MTLERIAKLLDLIDSNYEKYREASEDKKKLKVGLWYDTFKNDSEQTVWSAVQRYMISSPYPPTVADIREEIRRMSMLGADDLETALRDACKQVARLRMNSDGEFETCMTAEDFEKLPREIREFAKSRQGLIQIGAQLAFEPERTLDGFRRSARITQREMDLERVRGNEKLQTCEETHLLP